MKKKVWRQYHFAMNAIFHFNQERKVSGSGFCRGKSILLEFNNFLIHYLYFYVYGSNIFKYVDFR